MKIKLDENMPACLADVLGGLGHDVDTVPSEGLAGADDAVVCRAAWQAKRFLITQDIDLARASASSAGVRAGVLLVRLRKPGREALRRRVEQAFRAEDASKWAGCIVVLSETKLRIRRG